MGFFDFFRRPDINAGVEKFRSIPGAVLLDVRDDAEFRGGHIPGSMNIPIDRIGTVKEKIKDRETHIFTYCLGGHRSGQAARALKKIGYKNVLCIGGVTRYEGELERGELER